MRKDGVEEVRVGLGAVEAEEAREEGEDDGERELRGGVSEVGWGRVGASGTDQVEEERYEERDEDGFAVGFCDGGGGAGDS